jgi:protein-glutamine gamma-glutamyltransferase
VVTGYQGGENNAVDGFWTVRQSDAHAWAEVWVAGTGWVRVDPTSAVAPGRTGSFQRLEPPSNVFTQAIGAVNPAFVLNLRAVWEAANNRWNQWVLNYSRGQQFDLLRSLGVGSPDWTDLASVLITLLCGGALAGAAWAWWDRHRQDPWQRLQHRVQAQLAALGVAVEPHHGPRERARRVRLALGPRGDALAAELEALDRARYGDAAAGSASALRTWWAGFARAAKATPATPH